MSRFRLIGLAHEPFRTLFDLSARELERMHAVRMTADRPHGFPCRISLEDAAVGDEVLLLPYQHLPLATPYRASGPIFIRRGAVQRVLAPGDIPDYVSRRHMSLRAYDAAHRMIAAELCEGTAAAETIERILDDSEVAYIHLHNALRGCFSCRVERVN